MGFRYAELYLLSPPVNHLPLHIRFFHFTTTTQGRDRKSPPAVIALFLRLLSLPWLFVVVFFGTFGTLQDFWIWRVRLRLQQQRVNEPPPSPHSHLLTPCPPPTASAPTLPSCHTTRWPVRPMRKVEVKAAALHAVALVLSPPDISSAAMPSAPSSSSAHGGGGGGGDHADGDGDEVMENSATAETGAGAGAEERISLRRALFERVAACNNRHTTGALLLELAQQPVPEVGPAVCCLCQQRAA